MKELKGKNVKIFEGDLLRRETRNKQYLMSLENWQLLRSFQFEAGRVTGRGNNKEALDGWEDLSCQLRGHFLGHWLSAAAFVYEEKEDLELYAKTSAILDELKECQIDNGGEWACSIPEKYLYWIAKGKAVWAPQYTIHKLFMGLVDVYKIMKLEKALDIADHLADWFYKWSGQYSREEFDDILDVETGGMLEVWADLLEITGDAKYEELLKRYYRGRLFDPLLEGKDVLTNMHANTTIPEIMGCARAYEVTGDKKYLDIVKAYWKCAVTDRGIFVTGGQTQGEIWTPKMKFKARLGDKNQEHCTVYNMIRLADFLFKETKDPLYSQYIEYNVQNGIKAQAYWQGMPYEGSKGEGLLTYFLPLKAGSRKDWAGEKDSFFCCHGTMVQANAAWNRHIFYQDGNSIYVTQYLNAEADFVTEDVPVKVRVREDRMNGSLMNSSENNAKQTVTDTTAAYANKPDFKKYIVSVETGENAEITLYVRIPEWIDKKAAIYINDELVAETKKCDFVKIKRVWDKEDTVTVILPIGLKFITLPDDNTVGAFRYGSEVLAGITKEERVLTIETADPCKELSADTERQWGDFRTFYKTENLDPGISFMKLNEVGYEPYQVYFKIKK
ncbi:MAG: glycoside hydrolase family 127 protein [Lachnospiraceae bacterium]|nr:glycoside hydrolase family 127 protein [Lachnospiraceae bacterium]